MRKPKEFDFLISVEDRGISMLGYFYMAREIPKLIKWLEKVQKYNEFKNKKKKVKNGSKSKRD